MSSKESESLKASSFNDSLLCYLKVISLFLIENDNHKILNMTVLCVNKTSFVYNYSIDGIIINCYPKE